MTKEKSGTLEGRTNDSFLQIADLLEKSKPTPNLNWIGSKYHFQASYFQNLAICKQNEIIIDYLQEIYREMKK